MYHLRHNFQNIVFCVNALYDARQLGHIASAFSKVREREIANSQNTLCKQKILHFANSDFGIWKVRKLTFANTWPPLLQNSKTVGWQFWFRVSSKSQKIKMKHHAVMKPSFLVRFCLTISSESHTRHQLDKRSDEVRLRLLHRGAHRPQTYTFVK